MQSPHAEAARTAFTVILRKEETLPVLFHFIEHHAQTKVVPIRANLSGLTTEDQHRYERKLLSHCQGLLEVRMPKYESALEPSIECLARNHFWKVSFMHQTARDFGLAKLLNEVDAWKSQRTRLLGGKERFWGLTDPAIIPTFVTDRIGPHLYTGLAPMVLEGALEGGVISFLHDIDHRPCRGVVIYDSVDRTAEEDEAASGSTGAEYSGPSLENLRAPLQDAFRRPVHVVRRVEHGSSVEN